MREIKMYIKIYMGDCPFWKIEKYIRSFLQDGEITKAEYYSLITWTKEWYKAQ